MKELRNCQKITALLLHGKEMPIFTLMKPCLFAFALLLAGTSCNKGGDPPKSCSYGALPVSDFKNTTNTIIPIASKNSWTYTDTNRTGGTTAVSPDFLLKVSQLFSVYGHSSVSFNQFLPQQTIIGDSLFSTLETPESSNPGCYQLYRYLFPVTDTVKVNDAEIETILYPSKDTCYTPAGNYPDNIIYQTDSNFRMVIHPGIGILKVEMGLRKLTLKEYKL